MKNKNMFRMALCCLIPLALFMIIPILGISLGSVGLWAILLLCPLLHYFMMRGMHSDNKKEQGVRNRARGFPSPCIEPSMSRNDLRALSLEKGGECGAR